MVAPPFVPECITPNCPAHGNEGEATPTTTIGILRPLIYGGDSTLEVNPKYRLIIFLKEDLAGLTSMSEGVGDGDDGGDDGGAGGS